MEILFDEIKKDYLKHIKDDRTLIKWLDEENVEYFTKPNRCFQVEFLFAFNERQIREIKLKNPIDYANRIEKLKALEAKMLAPAPAQIVIDNIPPKTSERLNPIFKNQEKLLPLKLGKREAVPGLIIFCKHKDCKEKKKTGKCKHPAEYECYKLLINTKAVTTSFVKEFNGIRNEEEAKSLARELRRITILNGGKPKSLTVPEQTETKDLYILPNLIEEYLEHLLKIKGNLERFLKSERNMFDVMLQVFKDNGADPYSIRVDTLNDKLQDGYTWVRKIELAIIEREGKKKGKKISSTTKNNYMKLYRSPYKFANENRGLNLKNPFKTVKIENVKQAIKNNIKTISTKELSTLFKMLRNKEELNIKKTYFSKAKNRFTTKTFKYFQPYLLDGIKLAIASGYRSDNIVNVKWSDIDLTEAYSQSSILNGVIKVEDIKVNNQNKQFNDDNKKIILVRINKDMMELLIILGYKKYNGTERYILAPEHQHFRETIKNNVSKGFHHYMLKVNPLKDFQFKDLRKTQISHEGHNTGLKKTSKRIHARFSTTDNNYFDDDVTLSTAKENPTVFKGFRLSKL